MNIDERIKERWETTFAINHLAQAIEETWRSITFNLESGSFITSEMYPSKEQKAEWYKFATDTIHNAMKQALTKEKT